MPQECIADGLAMCGGLIAFSSYHRICGGSIDHAVFAIRPFWSPTAGSCRPECACQ